MSYTRLKDNQKQVKLNEDNLPNTQPTNICARLSQQFDFFQAASQIKELVRWGLLNEQAQPLLAQNNEPVTPRKAK